MSYRGPKAKKSRALGVALTTKSAFIMNRKPNAPGQHGGRRRGARSTFGEQLLEKQRLRFQYNLREKQLRKFFDQAKRRKGNTADELLRLLERRLDNFVYRAGFAPTIYAARQLVSHGHVAVNGRKIDRPGKLVTIEDVITIREKSRNMPMVQSALTQANPPGYIEASKEQFMARLTREPETEEIPVICRVPMVVEFYSR
jgi:small subunit ribosomal protein S4